MRWLIFKTENGALDSTCVPPARDRYFLSAKSVFIIVVLIGGLFLYWNIETQRHTLDLIVERSRSFFLAHLYGAEYSLSTPWSGLISARAVYRNDAPRAATAVPILVYHGILPRYDGSNINVSTATFKDHMFALKAAGYETITVGDLKRFLRGEGRLPEKPIMLTFDDGRFDSYKYADAVLRAADFQAVMFIITEHSTRDSAYYYLSGSQVKAMEKSGRWDIQAHTYQGHDLYPIDAIGNTGPFFGHRLWLSGFGRFETNDEFRRRVGDDMAKAKTDIKKLLGKDVTSFAFPFGDFGQSRQTKGIDWNLAGITLEEAAKQYDLLFFQNAPSIRFSENSFAERNKNDEAFLVKRIDISPAWKGEDLVSALSRGHPKNLPFVDTFDTDTGWRRSWGTATVATDKSVLVLDSSSVYEGAAAILNGSQLWRDYTVTATVSSPNQNSVFMWVRFQTDNNNAACNFGKGFVHIEQIENGQKHVIKGVRSNELEIPAGDFTVEARVHERTLECALNGKTLITSEFLSPELSFGGIGFKTWDPANGRGLLNIKKIAVEPLPLR